MKKIIFRTIGALMAIIALSLTACKGKSNKEELYPKKIEINKVTLDNKEYFDTTKMKIHRTWTLDNENEIKVIFKASVVGNLEPRAGNPLDDGYDAYYIKIFHDDISIEEWIFWLDNQFIQEGVAENAVNRGVYKLLSKKDVVEIGKLLTD